MKFNSNLQERQVQFKHLTLICFLSLRCTKIGANSNLRSISDGAKLKPVAVSQSSTYTGDDNEFGPSLAVDGNMDTRSHTNCGSNKEIWFKIIFRTFYCIRDTVFTQSATDGSSIRIDETKVWVVNSKRGSEHLCGQLRTGTVYTLEGQTYRIPCGMKCGDEVKLTLLGEDRTACIFLNEISVFGLLATG